MKSDEGTRFGSSHNIMKLRSMKRLPVFVVFFAVAGFNVSYCRERNLPSQSTVVAISGSSALGDNITINIRDYERPLLVTDSSVEGGTDEEWLPVFSKLMEPYSLSYDQYKEITTPAYLEMTGDSSESHFQGVKNKIRTEPPDGKTLKLSILSAVNVTCKSGMFMIITVYNGHVQSAKSPIIGNETASILLRKLGGKWKQESYNLMKESGIDSLPWEDLEAMRTLAKCSKAVLLDGKLHAQK